MSAEEIAAAMYLSAEMLQPAMDNLVNQGIFQLADTSPPSRYICLPKTFELRQALEETIKAYKDKRQAVIAAIFSSPLDYFSDAFRLKGR